MAWAKGTATDFIDFLRKMRDYAAGDIDPSVHATITSGVVVPSDDQWEILDNGSLQPDIPGSGFATDGEVYLQGQGSDPADAIIVGIKTYRNAGNNIFGWEIRGYTVFDDTLAFTTLPGVSPPCYAAFDDATFDCFFWVNSRRIMALARIGTTDILVHMGFIQQFGTRGQYPYPLLISGSVDDTTRNFAAGHFGQSSLPDPCDNGAYLRWVDGSWQEVRHYSNASDQRGQARESSGTPGQSYTKIWPQRDVTSNFGDEPGTDTNEENLFEQWSTTITQISSTEIGKYTLFPCIVHQPEQLIGRLDGLLVVNGLGLVAGDTITVGSDTYDVFKNTWRSEQVDFFAIKRE